MEAKLERTAAQIEKFAVLATIASVVTHAIFLLGLVMFSSERRMFSSETLLEMAKVAITAIVLLIVAIPEGLPLAVSIAMAMSIEQLKKDNILIKNIESVQTCAMLHDVCVSKTGTVTEGALAVRAYQICD